VESGILLRRLKEFLNRKELTLRHFPQSYPEAAVGGLIATMSTGQYSTKYGGIEDLVIDLELEVIREGSPMLLSVEGLDLEYGVGISLRMNAGLCVVRGLLRRYDEGCSISRRSLLRIKRKIKGLGRVISLSPEASHSLGIPFFLEEAHDLPVKLDYRGPVHMPCLLMGREEAVLRGLTSIGADPTEILNVCMKQDTPNALTLCPRASSLGLPCIYDLLEFPHSGAQG